MNTFKAIENKKLKILISVFIFCLLSATLSNAQQAEFYVDPVNGVDTNSGTSTSQAFKTIEKARQTVATTKNGGCMTGDIYVYLRGGVHTLSSTVEFTSTDSGTNENHVIYKNYGTEVPIVSSGEKITGTWQTDIGSIKKINIGSGKEFRQLYVNDTYTTRARTPNLGFTFTFDTEKAVDGFNIKKGVLDGLPEGWQNKVEIAANCAWMHKKLRVSGKYSKDFHDRAVINTTEWNDINNNIQGVRVYNNENYWIENAYKFLDKAGEWYYDDTSGWLYYWPLEGEDMSAVEVVIPNLEQAFFINGGDGNDFGSPVLNIQFEGLTFKYNNYTRPNHFGMVDVQANTLIPRNALDIFDSRYRHNQQKERITAALLVQNGKNITVKGCNFKNLGGTGLTFNYGGENILIESNTFKYIAGNGIEVGNDANKPNNVAMFPKNVTIFNNYVEDIAKDYRGGIGIFAFWVDGLLIEHNEILNVPYSGISAGWGWADGESPVEFRNYTIRYNKVSSYLGFIADGGGIYVTNPIFGTNIIEGNYVKDVGIRKVGSIAIYLDGNSRNWTLNNNVVNNAEYWLGGRSFLGQIKGPIKVTNSYTTTAVFTADTWGRGSSISGTNEFLPEEIPSAAQTIINNAGLSSGSAPIPTILPDPEPEPNSGTIILNIGDSDPEYIENGVPWFYSALEGYNKSTTRYSNSIGAFAAWTPNLLAGQYRVAIWKVNEASSDNNAKITVSHANGVDTKYLNFTTGSSGWVELGTYTFEKGLKGYVKNQFSGSTSRYMRTNAVKFEFVSDSNGAIVDNGDGGYSEEGTWDESGLLGNNNSSTRYGSSTGATASWEADLQAANYKVLIYKVVNVLSDDNAKIEITHEGGTDIQYLNYTTGTSGWVELGTYAFASGTKAKVQNTLNGNGYVRADAVKFEYVSKIVDNGDDGYSEAGTSWTESSLLGSSDSSTRYGTSTGATASWYADLPTENRYKVSIFKVVNASSDSNAKIEVVHSGGTNTQYLNYTTGTSGWVELGDFTFNECGGAFVKNTRNSSGFIRADAVKFELVSKKNEDQTLVNKDNVAIEKVTSSFFVYPNPVSEVLNIVPAKIINNVDILLYDIRGKALYNKRIKLLNKEINIPVSHLASGIYVLSLNSKSGREQFKIIIN